MAECTAGIGMGRDGTADTGMAMDLDGTAATDPDGMGIDVVRTGAGKSPATNVCDSPELAVTRVQPARFRVVIRHAFAP